MANSESKPNFIVRAINGINSEFDNYACSSPIFNFAGYYSTLMTMLSFFMNIYAFVPCIFVRNQVIEEHPTKNLYGLTKFSMFLKFPALNFNVYDIMLVLKYCEIIRLFGLLKNIMKNVPALQSASDGIIFIHFPILIMSEISNYFVFSNYTSGRGWIILHIVEIVNWSQWRCYVFNYLQRVTK